MRQITGHLFDICVALIMDTIDFIERGAAVDLSKLMRGDSVPGCCDILYRADIPAWVGWVLIGLTAIAGISGLIESFRE